MGKKNLSKSKKLRKQLLAASAAGLVLVSSAASAGTSLVYAAEKNQTATTAEKNTKNSEAISNENTLTQKQNLTATERKTVNPSNLIGILEKYYHQHRRIIILGHYQILCEELLFKLLFQSSNNLVPH